MKEQQVKKTFLPQDIAVLAAIFAAGTACFLPGEGWGGLGVIIILCGVLMVPFYLAARSCSGYPLIKTGT